MSNGTKTGQKPTRELFAVKEGADGKGFSLKFDFYPADPQQAIQLRTIKAKEEKPA
jgi:hypothetical protein